MYVIYGQKTRGDRIEDYPLNAQIRFLSDLFDNQCWIFSVPGHMSRDEKVSDYIQRFNELISTYSDKEQYIAFGNGYNATTKNKYAKEIDGNGHYLLRNYKVDLPAVKRNNHAKMLFYFMWKDEEKRKKYEVGDETLSREKLNEFLGAVSVRAIIIGSSNQSHATYFNETADKGEADVLLLPSSSEPKEEIKDEGAFIKDIKLEHGNNDLGQRFVDTHRDFFDHNIISKSLFLVKGCDTEEEYFKEIFRSCLTGELK